MAIVVIGVLVLSIVVGVYFSRQPPPWDEIGGESPVRLDELEQEPSTFDDEAALRALVAEKRARRRAAADGAIVASDRLHPEPGTASPDQGGSTGVDRSGPPWAHLDADVVEEARGLVARRRARLERTGKAVPDEQAELQRLLGPEYL